MFKVNLTMLKPQSNNVQGSVQLRWYEPTDPEYISKNQSAQEFLLNAKAHYEKSMIGLMRINVPHAPAVEFGPNAFMFAAHYKGDATPAVLAVDTIEAAKRAMPYVLRKDTTEMTSTESDRYCTFALGCMGIYGHVIEERLLKTANDIETNRNKALVLTYSVMNLFSNYMAFGVEIYRKGTGVFVSVFPTLVQDFVARH